MAERERRTGAAARTPQRTCVVFSAHPWGDTPFGLHHIARSMAQRSWKVLFLETPFTPLHALAGRSRGRARTRDPRPTEHPNLAVYSPFLLLPMSSRGFVGGWMPIEHWTRFTSPGVAAALRGSEFASPDLFLLGSPLGLPLRKALGPKLTAYRLADDLSLLPRIGMAFIAAERSAVGAADAVVATTARLAAKAEEMGASRTISAPNGVDIEHFSRPRPEPPEYSGAGRPRVIFSGSLERWVDHEAMIALARARPHYSIFLVGPGRGARWLDRVPSNVTWVPKRPYGEMPAYLQHADVGLVAFAESAGGDFLGSVDPLKLYEYRAARLAAVAPSRLGSAITGHDSGIILYDGPHNLIPAVDRAVAEAGRVRSMPLAKDHDWLAITDRLLEALGCGR